MAAMFKPGARTCEFRRPDGRVIARVAERNVHGVGLELAQPYELWVLEPGGWRLFWPADA